MKKTLLLLALFSYPAGAQISTGINGTGYQIVNGAGSLTVSPTAVTSTVPVVATGVVSPALSAGAAAAGTDQAGGDETISPKQGTGAGTAGKVVIQAPTKQATGSGVQPLVTVATFQDSGTGGVSAPQVLVPTGTSSAPGISHPTYTTTGVAIGNSVINLYTGTSNAASFGNNGQYLALQAQIANVILKGPATSTLQVGGADAATQLPGIIQASNARSGIDTDKAGGTMTIRPGAGTGTGTGSSVIIQAPTAQTTGTGAQPQVTIATFQDSGTGGTSKPLATFGGSISISGSSSTGFLSMCASGIACVGTADGTTNVNLRAYDFEAFQSNAAGFIQGNAYLTGLGSAAWQLGKPDAASPVAQTLKVQDGTGTNTNAAAAFTHAAPAGTGTGIPGKHLFTAPRVGTTGTTAHTQYPVLTLSDGGSATVSTPTVRIVSSTVGTQMVSSTKTLTNNSATGVVDVTVPSGGGCGGMLAYTAIVTGTGPQVQSYNGMINYATANNAGTIATAITEGSSTGSHDAKALSTGTVTGAWTNVSGTGKSTLTVNVNSNLTTPVVNIYIWASLDGSAGCALTGL